MKNEKVEQQSRISIKPKNNNYIVLFDIEMQHFNIPLN